MRRNVLPNLFTEWWISIQFTIPVAGREAFFVSRPSVRAEKSYSIKNVRFVRRTVFAELFSPCRFTGDWRAGFDSTGMRCRQDLSLFFHKRPEKITKISRKSVRFRKTVFAVYFLLQNRFPVRRQNGVRPTRQYDVTSVVNIGRRCNKWSYFHSNNSMYLYVYVLCRRFQRRLLKFCTCMKKWALKK